MPTNADVAVIVRRTRSEARPEAQRPSVPAPVVRAAVTFNRREDALARLKELFERPTEATPPH